MRVEELSNDFLKIRADNKRLQANKVISECLEKGVGAYLITDDENIYSSKDNMFSYLRHSAWKTNNREKDKKFNVEVITRNKKSQIIVVVEEV